MGKNIGLKKIFTEFILFSPNKNWLNQPKIDLQILQLQKPYLTQPLFPLHCHQIISLHHPTFTLQRRRGGSNHGWVAAASPPPLLNRIMRWLTDFFRFFSGAYTYVSELWKKKQSDVMRFLLRVRCWEYRQLPAVVRVTRPTRPDKARRLGYKAKQVNKFLFFFFSFFVLDRFAHF